jgi:hypothetical protein
MNTTSKLSNYTHEQIVDAFTKYATNQRKCDKSALQYFIGMISGHKHMESLFSCYTRAEVTARLLQLINQGNNVYKCIQSDYTEEQLLKYLTPKETPMKTKQIVDAYVNAMQTGNWDYPEGSQFETAAQVYEIVRAGYTIYGFARQAVIRYGSVTGGVMAFGGLSYVSQSTRKAIREGVKYAQNN